MGFAYVTSIPGLIKIVEEVFNFIAFMCIACHNWTTNKGDAFIAASVGAFIITGIFLVIYVLDLQEKIALPWIQIQFYYCIVWAIFYLVTAALVIDLGRGTKNSYEVEGLVVEVGGGNNDSYIAGGVFGLFATVTYIIDAFFKFQKKM